MRKRHIAPLYAESFEDIGQRKQSQAFKRVMIVFAIAVVLLSLALCGFSQIGTVITKSPYQTLELKTNDPYGLKSSIYPFAIDTSGPCKDGDSSAKVHVKRHFGNGLYFEDDVWTCIPKAQIIYKTDTLIQHDTIRVPIPCKPCPECPIDPIPIPDDSTRKEWSKSSLPFDQFIYYCQQNRYIAVIDKSATITMPTIISGDVVIEGKNRPTLRRSGTGNLFELGVGNHVITGLDVVMDKGTRSVFFTIVQPGIIWNNVIKGVNVIGGQQAYESARGGKQGVWCGTTIEDCVFKTEYICVSNFSQDGPYKFLHMKNVDLYCNLSHNIYAHPNVSLRLYNVRSMKIGESVSSDGMGVALHHFSGGGVPGMAEYVELRRCITNWTDSIKGGMWQIAEPRTKRVILDSCDGIALYSIPRPRIVATNSRFFNGGTAGFFGGEITNCKGYLWPTDSATITNCDLTELNFAAGGKGLVVSNTKATDCFGDKYYPIFVTLTDNTTIGAMMLTNPMPSEVRLKNGAVIKSYKWGWVAPPGMIVQEGR